MKLAILDKGKKKAGERMLPRQFSEEYRPDLIKRAVLALQSAMRQVYGTSPEAGFRHSSKLSKRRRNYRGSYGFGISRVNRKILSRRGTRMNWVGAFSPQTRGGHRSHPPKAQKQLEERINKKENRKAIRSAIAATVDKAIVAARGHIPPTDYPFIVGSWFEQLAKTQDVENALQELGFGAELQRSLLKKVRAGKGKLRGRRYQRKRGLLVVVSAACPVQKAAQNVPGVDVVLVQALNAQALAPGAAAGRVTLWTENALKLLEEKKLFL